MDGYRPIYLWTWCFCCGFALVFGTSPSTITWVPDYTVQNVHFLDRLTTTEAPNLHKCATECYARPSCICMGYSENFGQCQLYDINVGYFDVGLIAQDMTTIYRTSCENTEYTYVRNLDTCMKLHKDPKSYTAASQKCSSESSEILQMDLGMLSYMNKLYHNLGGTFYFVNGMLSSGTHVNMTISSGQLLVPIENMAWIPGEPDTNKDCIVLTWNHVAGTTGLKTHDCSDNLWFFCGHSPV